MSESLYNVLTEGYKRASLLVDFEDEVEQWKTQHVQPRRFSKQKKNESDQIFLKVPVKKSQKQIVQNDSDTEEEIHREKKKKITQKVEKNFKFPNFSLLNEKEISTLYANIRQTQPQRQMKSTKVGPPPPQMMQPSQSYGNMAFKTGYNNSPVISPGFPSPQNLQNPIPQTRPAFPNVAGPYQATPQMQSPYQKSPMPMQPQNQYPQNMYQRQVQMYNMAPRPPQFTPNQPQMQQQQQMPKPQPQKPQDMKDLTLEINEFFCKQRERKQQTAKQENIVRLNPMQAVKQEKAVHFGMPQVPKPITNQYSPAGSPYPSRSPQPSSPVVEYVNQEVMKNNFGIITNQNASIPLILDNSDSSIKFTERKDVDTNAGNKNNVVLDWDNLDFENTEYYTKIVDKNSTRVKLDLQHSTTANNLYLIDPNPKNLDRIHHPNLDTQRDYKVKYKRIGVKYQESEGAISPYLSDINDLTGTKGTLILLEQTSECPPFILNVGMTSRLVKYWHQSTPDDIPRQMDSLTHLIKPDQESPFIAPIQKSKFVCSISCNLFDVPVAKHEVSQCDFLLVRGMERNQKTKCIEPTNTFYIRRVNAYYCAGLLEAKQRVMRPNKKTTQEFVSNYIKAILINIFRGTEQLPPKKKIQVASVLKEFFPDQNELKLREVLKKFAQHFRNHGNGYWEPRNQNELTQKFQEISIQPENVCSYQSMQAGFKRLRRSGVNILIRSRKVYQQIKNLKGELTKRVAYKIEMELMKTPWARTENFTKAFEGQLMEISRADNGEEIVRSKGRRGKNEGKEQGEQKKQARHGTSSDLRVLTIPQLNEKLKQYKVTMERINKLSRWQRVKLLKELVNEKAQQGIVNDDITKFARGPRSEFQAKVEEYKKIYESSFRNNLVFISSSTNDDSKNDFDDDSLFDMINVEIARQDSDDTDSDSDDYNPNEDSQNNQSQLVEDADDPPELKPYGIATHKFDVNWAELGFEGCAMRKAAKIINVKLEQSKPVVTISWRRAPHQISELEKLENFVNSELSKVKQEDDLETHILQKRKKELQDKLRRAKNSKKKGATSVGSYIQCQHQTFLITDSYNKSLSFDLRSLIVEQIRDANMRYNNFLSNYNPRKKQTSNQANSSSDNDDGFNDAENYTIQKNPRRPNSLVSFNDCIESIINKLIENKAYQCFTYQPTNKSTPDILKELPLNLYSIRDEAHNQRYVSVQKFYDDFKSISDYCKTINSENIKSLCNQMMKEFNDMFMKNKDDLERFANGIDPAFLN